MDFYFNLKYELFLIKKQEKGKLKKKSLSNIININEEFYLLPQEVYFLIMNSLKEY